MQSLLYYGKIAYCLKFSFAELWWIMIDYHWYVAVLFNGYVVGYSSRFGDSLDPLNKPWAVIIFVVSRNILRYSQQMTYGTCYTCVVCV
jgi:hypothetical protein